MTTNAAATARASANATPARTGAGPDLAVRLAAPAGRTLLAGLFLISGVSKISAYEATQGYMEAMGVPGALLPAAIAFEIAAPLALIAGWRARFAAFLLAGFSVVTAFIFHGAAGDQIQQIMFLKNIALAGGLLTIVANGPGPFSVDRGRA